MAKERTAKPTASVAAKAAQKTGKEVLKQNPGLKEVYVTSDGVAFFLRNDAQNHARTLQNRDVYNVKLNEPKPEPEADSAEEPASENPESTETPTDNAEADN